MCLSVMSKTLFTLVYFWTRRFLLPFFIWLSHCQNAFTIPFIHESDVQFCFFSCCFRNSISTIHIVWIEIFLGGICMQSHLWMHTSVLLLLFFFYFFYYVVKYLCSHEFYSQWIFTYKLTLSSLFPSLSVRIVFKKKWWYANVMIPFDFNAFVKKW